MALRPKLLLLDEVMAGLNAVEVDEVVAVIKRIRDSGVTLLVVEHVMQASPHPLRPGDRPASR